MSDKSDKLMKDLTELQKSFNQVFTVISKCINQLDKVRKSAKEVESELPA